MAVKTRAARKRRILRARAHQKKTRTSAVGFVEKQLGTELLPWQKDAVKAVAAKVEEEPPTRATCPSCGTRQKVRKDGTFGKHRTTLASDPLEAVDCAGIGQRWDTAPA